jgi:hypothetical protein
MIQVYHLLAKGKGEQITKIFKQEAVIPFANAESQSQND